MSNVPNRKVSIGASGGLPIGIILVWVMGEAGIDMPAEVGAAIGTLATGIVAYLTRE